MSTGEPNAIRRSCAVSHDFQSLEDVEERLLAFQPYYESIATPFEWRFTKDDLAGLMRKLGEATALAVAA